MIQGACLDADQNLVLAGLRVRDVFVAQNFRTAELVDADSFHEGRFPLGNKANTGARGSSSIAVQLRRPPRDSFTKTRVDFQGRGTIIRLTRRAVFTDYAQNNPRSDDPGLSL